MLDEAELIHMGGRVYDPLLGRFLSADPNIPEPGNSQSFNRYAYVYNNPLSYTDPSGFISTWVKWHGFVKEPQSLGMAGLFGSAGESWDGSGSFALGFGTWLHSMRSVLEALARAQAQTDGKYSQMANCVDNTSCQGVGDFAKLNSQQVADMGIDSSLLSNTDSGFQAAIFSNANTGEVVVALAGTDFSDIAGDVKNNIQQALGKVSEQYQQVVRLADAVVRAVGNSKLTFTGNSLGGGLASVAAARVGATGVTFNAAGISDGTLSRYGITRAQAAQHVRAWRSSTDVLTLMQATIPLMPTAIGTPYTIPSFGGFHTLPSVCSGFSLSC